MNRDEESALEVLERNRQQHRSAIEAFNGQWLKEIGDGILISFDTVSDAVACAIRLQESPLQEGDLRLRIGIHQGEVVFEGNDVFGDGVNIAARIEAIAPIGGIFISETVARNIANKKGINTRFVGSRKLKNVGFPVRIYQIDPGTAQENSSPFARFLSGRKVQAVPAWAAPALLVLLLVLLGWFAWEGFVSNPSAATNTNTNTKTIAVLPFADLSPEEGSSFFADGVHEDVHNKLAGLQNLNVISRTSVMKYRDYEGDLRSLGKQLRAGYFVEGSVVRWNDTVRVMARLIDASNDQSLWSGRYDSPLEEVFSLQSKIAEGITQTLNTRISSEEKSRMLAIPTNNPDAYDDFIKARNILNASWVPYEKLKQATRILQQAVEKDPGFSEAWGWLSIAQSQLYRQESGFDDKEEAAEAAASAAKTTLEKARVLDPGNALALRAVGHYQLIVQQDAINALRSFDKALEAFPNDAATLMDQAMIYLYMGDIAKVIENGEKAYQLENDNGMIIYGLTTAYEMARRYSDMVPFFEQLLEIEPEMTHYELQAKYYQFLSDGKLESFRAYEQAVRTVERTDKCNIRTVQDNEMTVAMANGEFDRYFRAWSGKWDRHHASHGNWSC
ncbi:MAG: adenylate/guanylate cyclase domain-containing protein, partial [Saprospiraceae bacterium]|nr:adenylate/guanylate cyclase domain-containing protein [Saprospiraceae bacterium]